MLAIALDADQFIEFGIVAFLDQIAFPHGEWGLGVDGSLEKIFEIDQRIEITRRFAQALRPGRR